MRLLVSTRSHSFFYVPTSLPSLPPQEKKQQEMQMKMQEEMLKFQGAGVQGMGMFQSLGMGGLMPPQGMAGSAAAVPGDAPIYTYGPNGELVLKQ